MSKAYLNKYENGKSQTLQARDRANGVLHESRVREYLDELDAAPHASSPVVITVAPANGKRTDPAKPMAQMMLFDQPVNVTLAEPDAPPVSTPTVRARPSAEPAPAMLRPVRQTAAMHHQPSDEMTLRGILKGCGLGLATAAALLLAYLAAT